MSNWTAHRKWVRLVFALQASCALRGKAEEEKKGDEKTHETLNSCEQREKTPRLIQLSN